MLVMSAKYPIIEFIADVITLRVLKSFSSQIRSTETSRVLYSRAFATCSLETKQFP